MRPGSQEAAAAPNSHSLKTRIPAVARRDLSRVSQ
jgi:hypothetical protein